MATVVYRRPSKYRARPTVVDGVRFASRREAGRWSQLRLLEMAGAIRNLERQPAYPLRITSLNGESSVVCGTYRADFRYYDLTTGSVIVEDVKSPPTKTTAYRLRKRIVEVLYGIAILET